MILVYKTNINSTSKARETARELNKLLPTAAWNFDLEDCDNILRIDTKHNISTFLQSAMQKIGIEIEALPD